MPFAVCRKSKPLYTGVPGRKVKKNLLNKKSPCLSNRQGLVLYSFTSVYQQPQLPVLQDPELQPPPPPTGLVEVMEKPERYPASRKSTLMAPQESSNPSSTRKVTLSS